jgi:hypothetical protein
MSETRTFSTHKTIKVESRNINVKINIFHWFRIRLILPLLSCRLTWYKWSDRSTHPTYISNKAIALDESYQSPCCASQRCLAWKICFQPLSPMRLSPSSWYHVEQTFSNEASPPFEKTASVSVTLSAIVPEDTKDTRRSTPISWELSFHANHVALPIFLELKGPSLFLVLWSCSE